MALAGGTRLGHFEVIGLLGSGGMGEVYRAVDTTLRREVALKLLPAAFARNPDRLARFEREAHVLASLNHPHIAAIYGFERLADAHFLVLELVEGPTLADLIAGRDADAKPGGLPLGRALAIAIQIAEALDAAHEKGIVHRDLKPANVKVTPGGTVKVLDFGLAKAFDEQEAVDLTHSPTLTALATRAGVVLGTASYMSPEQAAGTSVDRRADVWAFGAVLFELLTGRRAFDGKTVSHAIVSVMEQEPEWDRLPATTPPGVRRLLQRCLQKDPSQRYRDIGDVRLQLHDLATRSPAVESGSRPAAARSSTQRWAWPLAATVALVATASLAIYLYQRPAPSVHAVRFEVPAPDLSAIDDSFSVSPDGRKLAFVVWDTNRVRRLSVRSFDTLDAHPLAGTEGVFATPVWSPDSRFIAFWASTPAPGKLKKIAAAGGPVETLCEVPEQVLGGFWAGERIVLATTGHGLRQVPAGGGALTVLTALDASRNERAHGSPSLLPDGRHFVYARLTDRSESAGIYIGSLDDAPDRQPATRLLPDRSKVVYAGRQDGALGHLLFVRSRTLMSQAFDAENLTARGEPNAVVAPIEEGFGASATGVLVYRTAAAGETSQLTWFDRGGRVLGQVGEPGLFGPAPALSPDGTQLAVQQTNAQSGNIDVWLYDLARGGSTRLTFDPGADTSPIWSPDGRQIAFRGVRNGRAGAYQMPSNGAGNEKLLFALPEGAGALSSWSPDGRSILYTATDPMSGSDVWVLRLGETPSSPARSAPLLRSEFGEAAARFSPDGRWISYVSTESGRDEIYLRQFDPDSSAIASSGKWKVSRDGGISAHWREDGREIVYVSGNGDIMAVDVVTTPAFRSGVPNLLFRGPSRPRAVPVWTESGDFQRFLISVPSAERAGAASFVVVLNWQAALGAREKQ
jgi:serine/threonine protein kinase